MITTRDLRRLERNAAWAAHIMAREQARGRTDMSVQQTRRIALSVANAQKHVGAYERALRDMARPSTPHIGHICHIPSTIQRSCPACDGAR